MVLLSYDRYGAQDGDWGAAITMQLGRNSVHCVVIHLNMPIGWLQQRRSSVQPRKSSRSWLG